MSVYVCGFLEISGHGADYLHEDYAWMSCLDLSSLGLSMGDECRILFGESKYAPVDASKPDEWPFLAHRRELPNNMSFLTRQEIKEALEHDTATMSGWGFTWISYEEIAQLDWQAYAGAKLDSKSHGWGLLFSLMQVLDTTKHQRLIVWFQWL